MDESSTCEVPHNHLENMVDDIVYSPNKYRETEGIKEIL